MSIDVGQDTTPLDGDEMKWLMYPFAFEAPIGSVIAVTDEDFIKSGGALPRYGKWKNMTAEGDSERTGYSRYRRVS